LHVLMLSDYYPPHISGGVEKVAFELCRGLSKKGHSLSVLTYNYHSAPAIEETDEATIHRLPSIPLTNVLKRQYTISLYTLPRLIQLIRRLKPAIIHANNRYFSTTMALSFLGPFLTTPIITTLHIGNLQDDNKLNAIFGTYDRTIGRHIIRGSNHVIAVSDGVAEYTRAVCGDSFNLSVIPNGVDTNVFCPDKNSPDKAPIVLFVGRLLRNKGPETLVRAIPLVLAKNPQAQFWIVGDGPLKDDLQRLIGKLDVVGAVKFLGVRKNVADIMRKATVFSRPSSLEGMSLTILEAMASGLPVIATPVTGTVELIKDGYNGYLVAISDFEMLAKKINSVLENQPLAAQMGQRSRDIVKGKYGWDAVVDRTEQVYIEEAGVY